MLVNQIHLSNVEIGQHWPLRFDFVTVFGMCFTFVLFRYYNLL